MMYLKVGCFIWHITGRFSGRFMDDCGYVINYYLTFFVKACGGDAAIII